MFTFAEKINFLLGNQLKFSQLKLVLRSWKKVNKLDGWYFGLPKTKRWKCEMNGTTIQLESLQSLLHMLTDEHLTLIVQQNLGPRVIGIKVHLRQSKGTLALWKPIRNTIFDEIHVWRFSHIFVVFSEDMNFSLQWLGIEIKNNKARHKIRIVNTARWP